MTNFIQVYKKEKVLGGGRERISGKSFKRVDDFSPTAAGSHFNSNIEAKRGGEVVHMDVQEDTDSEDSDDSSFNRKVPK